MTGVALSQLRISQAVASAVTMRLKAACGGSKTIETLPVSSVADKAEQGQSHVTRAGRNLKKWPASSPKHGPKRSPQRNSIRDGSAATKSSRSRSCSSSSTGSDRSGSSSGSGFSSSSGSGSSSSSGGSTTSSSSGSRYSRRRRRAQHSSRERTQGSRHRSPDSRNSIRGRRSPARDKPLQRHSGSARRSTSPHASRRAVSGKPRSPARRKRSRSRSSSRQRSRSYSCRPEREQDRPSRHERPDSQHSSWRQPRVRSKSRSPLRQTSRPRSWRRASATPPRDRPRSGSAASKSQNDRPAKIAKASSSVRRWGSPSGRKEASIPVSAKPAASRPAAAKDSRGSTDANGKQTSDPSSNLPSAGAGRGTSANREQRERTDGRQETDKQLKREQAEVRKQQLQKLTKQDETQLERQELRRQRQKQWNLEQQERQQAKQQKQEERTAQVQRQKVEVQKEQRKQPQQQQALDSNMDTEDMDIDVEIGEIQPPPSPPPAPPPPPPPLEPQRLPPRTGETQPPPPAPLQALLPSSSLSVEPDNLPPLPPSVVEEASDSSPTKLSKSQKKLARVAQKQQTQPKPQPQPQPQPKSTVYASVYELYAAHPAPSEQMLGLHGVSVDDARLARENADYLLKSEVGQLAQLELQRRHCNRHFDCSLNRSDRRYDAQLRILWDKASKVERSRLRSERISGLREPIKETRQMVGETISLINGLTPLERALLGAKVLSASETAPAAPAQGSQSSAYVPAAASELPSSSIRGAPPESTPLRSTEQQLENAGAKQQEQGIDQLPKALQKTPAPQHQQLEAQKQQQQQQPSGLQPSRLQHASLVVGRKQPRWATKPSQVCRLCTPLPFVTITMAAQM